MAKQRRKSSQRTRSSMRERREKRKRDILVIIVCLVVVLVVGFMISRVRTGKTDTVYEVNDSVLSYEPLIEQYAATYDVSEFVAVIEAMMQQESSGQGTDVMQCSECYYNTAYSQSPGSIDDPEYSIDTGIHYFSDCLELANCTSPEQTSRLKLALQGYNYGHNYINWALKNYGGYSQTCADAFAEQMKESLGWDSYGDPEYPAHVLRYYHP